MVTEFDDVHQIEKAMKGGSDLNTAVEKVVKETLSENQRILF